MNEKIQDFRRLSALLIGNKAERPRKHLQLTSAFSLGILIPHWVYRPGKYPALRIKKQCVRGKPLNSLRPYWRWNRNQGALVPWVKNDEHSTEKDNSVKTRFQRNAWSLGKSCQNCWAQWNEMPKSFLSETTLCSGRLSTIIILRD